MNAIIPVSAPRGEALYIRVAREIAIDHFPIDEILSRYNISPENWQIIKEDPRFIRILSQETEDWQSALNTHERTKLKAAAMVEEWLPEANSRLHDKNEALPAKVALGKLVSQIAGMGVTGMGIEGGSGDKISVTINLGEDKKLKFERQVTPKVIEAEAN